MRSKQNPKWAIVGAGASLAVAVVSSIAAIGHPARMVNILSIFAGGMGSGASLARILSAARQKVRDRLIAFR